MHAVFGSVLFSAHFKNFVFVFFLFTAGSAAAGVPALLLPFSVALRFAKLVR